MSKKCGLPAGSFIAGHCCFTCVLEPGHEGKHQRGGTCFKHGEYAGANCPQWPDCVPQALGQPAAPPAPASEQAQEDFIWRKLLWLNHARYLPFEHAPYGDDGEMQCCGIDFKRMKAMEIDELLVRRSLQEQVKAKEPTR